MSKLHRLKAGQVRPGMSMRTARTNFLSKTNSNKTKFLFPHSHETIRVQRPLPARNCAKRWKCVRKHVPTVFNSGPNSFGEVDGSSLQQARISTKQAGMFSWRTLSRSLKIERKFAGQNTAQPSDALLQPSVVLKPRSIRWLGRPAPWKLPTEPVHGQRHLPALHDELVPWNGAQAVGPPGAPLHESSTPEQPLQPLWKNLQERLLPGQEGRRPLRLRSPPADDVRHCHRSAASSGTYRASAKDRMRERTAAFHDLQMSARPRPRGQPRKSSTSNRPNASIARWVEDHRVPRLNHQKMSSRRASNKLTAEETNNRHRTRLATCDQQNLKSSCKPSRRLCQFQPHVFFFYLLFPRSLSANPIDGCCKKNIALVVNALTFHRQT